MCKLFLSIALIFPLFSGAQGVQNLYMAGGSYTNGASPSFAGTALYAHQIGTSSTYFFTMLDVLPNTIKPITVTTNVGTGIAMRWGSIGKIGLFTPTTAGISYTGTNTGWVWTTGFGAPFQVKSGYNWYLMPSVRVVKSSVSGGTGYQPVFGLLVGWGK